ncbi:helix-turn-helix transcriptional regulator [Lebetimonas sp. JS032]|uniref:helix-turn-helix transcriptional regulator n=1 Tax=Lebetimonas sp. JS032 TaxID=990070 RepID=UPI00350F8A36
MTLFYLTIFFSKKVRNSIIYNIIKTKNFPSPIKFGRSSRWVEEKVEEWINYYIKG